MANGLATTLPMAIGHHAAQFAHATAVRFLNDGDGAEDVLSFAEFDRRARSIAAILRSRRLQGECVLIVCAPGLDYICGFAGCLYAGAIAVPAPWQPGRRPWERLQSMMASAKPRAALISSMDGADIANRLKTIPYDIALISLADIDPSSANDWQPASVDEGSVALLQFTSGSTGAPKGVMVTHGNLAHQRNLIGRRFGRASRSKVVTWLPPYHDMGLIGCLTTPLYLGWECIWMAPATFLREPSRWLKAISRYGADISGGPGFAYDLCVEKISAESCADIDLRSWSVAFNGAEPVRHRTLCRFAERFAPSGFRPEAFAPCYGLAEATLMVSGARRATGPYSIAVDVERILDGEVSESIDGSGKRLVSSGLAEPDVVIVDPRACVELPSGRVGEIWVTGASVAAGYWDDPAASTDRLGALLAGKAGSRYLRTGDLGFLKDRELFITGRLSDLIVIRGKNHHPQDIESTVECAAPSLRANASIAFAIEHNETEVAVVVAETTARSAADIDRTMKAICRAVAEEHGLDLHASMLVRAGSLPRTTSGKLRRNAARQLFLAEGFSALGIFVRDGVADLGSEGDVAGGSGVFERSSFDAIATAVRAEWKDVLRVSEVTPADEFYLCGGNSLKAVQLSGRLADVLELEIFAEAVLDNPVFSDLVRWIALNATPRSARGSVASDTDNTDQHKVRFYPLSEAQQRIWFLEHLRPGNPFYHVGIRLDLDGPVDDSALERAVNAVIARHEALRAVFSEEGGVPRQEFLETAPAQLATRDLRSVKADQISGELDSIVHNEAVREFDLVHGPMVRLLRVLVPGGRTAVILVIHHLACDGWSVRIVLQDLMRAYHAALRQRPVEFPRLRQQFGSHCLHRSDPESGGERNQKLREFWTTILRAPPATDLPADRDLDVSGVASGGVVVGQLDSELVTRLTRVAATHRASIFMMLACALQVVISRWTLRDDVIIGTAVANRGKGLNDVVGCMMNFVAIRTSFANARTLGEALDRSLRASRDALAHQDYPFQQVVKDLGPDARLGRTPLYRVGLWMHNYVEALQFSGSSSVWPSLVDTRTAELDFRLLAIPAEDGAIRLNLEYDAHRFHAETAQAVLDVYGAILRALIVHPLLPLSEVSLPERLRRKAGTRHDSREIVFAANFTAAPLGEFITYWIEALGFDAATTFYDDKLLSSLIDPANGGPARDDALIVVLLDLEAWLGDGTEVQRTQNLHFAARRFARSLTRWPTTADHLIYLCPRSPEVHASAPLRNALDAATALIEAAADIAEGIHVFDLAGLLEAYRVGECRDPYAMSLGDIPFNDSFFAATGTIVARHLRAIWDKPRKMLAVDCDDVLWRGSCGELGPHGVGIDEGHRLLHQKLIKLYEEGVLLCLVSSNVEEDVNAVFQSGRMSITLDHFVARRVNWLPKSENLKSIVEQVGIGLESIVFIDNCAVQCAEVRDRIPEVVVLQFPMADDDISRFVDHLWAFDKFVVSDEDLTRNASYVAEARRKAAYSSTKSREEFIRGLMIEINVAAVRVDELPRIVQLFQRTNQFNLTGRSYQTSTLQGRMNDPGTECWSIRISDRFGDYGLAGALLFETSRPVLTVEAFVLSCRVLGRDVEFRILDQLIEAAARAGCSEIAIPFLRTGRNVPAFQFVTAACPETTGGNGAATVYRLSIGSSMVAAGTRDRPGASTSVSKALPVEQDITKLDTDSALAPRARAIESISGLWNAREIVSRVRSHTCGRSPDVGPFMPPREGLETIIASLMAEVLQVDKVGRNDTFFSLGGYSLLAVRLLGRIQETCSVRLSLEELFIGPTVADLAGAVASAVAGAVPDLEDLISELDGLSDEEAREGVIRG